MMKMYKVVNIDTGEVLFKHWDHATLDKFIDDEWARCLRLGIAKPNLQKVVC